MLRRLSLLGCMVVSACTEGYRGLETPHQPVVSSDAVTVPGCPAWEHQVGGEQESQSSNFGCATSTNLATMIADPIDLLHGRGDSTPAEVATRSIKAWRDAAPTSKNWQVTTSVSTGGK